jgi:hypothetical protein
MDYWQMFKSLHFQMQASDSKDYQKEQGWLYQLLCASFTQTILTKIHIYEPNTFRDFLMKWAAKSF